MFGNLLIKWKLAILMAIMVLALAIVGFSGYAGIVRMSAAVDEVGKVRLPSIQGLLGISEGQTAVTAADLTAAIAENDYLTAGRFDEALRLRAKGWASIDKGWKLYEPLPQTVEEEGLWKQFLVDWDGWKNAEAKVAVSMTSMARNSDEQVQKTLFVAYYRDYAASRAYFLKAEAALDKVQRLNDDIAKVNVTASAEASAAAKRNMLISAVLSTLVAVSCAILISRSISVPINKAVRIAQTVAAGDLTSHIVATTADETGQLLRALHAMNQSLVKIVSEVRSGTDTIATASAQISNGNFDLSSRTEEQASSLEETAASMEEMTSTVKQNTENAEQASQRAMLASSIAVRGGVVVNQVVETMNSINASSNKIVDIIGVIDGIAFQTNILALNAAVEAARAGEQGRGFAVVASEVRNLAQRSAAAAKEIKTLINDSVAQVATGSRLVAHAGVTMGEIVASIQHVSDIMGDISQSTREQSSGIDQINIAVSQMDQVTQQNAALVEEAAAAAASLEQQASVLASVVSTFTLDSNEAQIEPLNRPASTQQLGAAPRRVPKLTTRPAVTALANDDWEQF
ncbi:methyl-accepting chemotaxis protein [Massilia sp. S19_KUP03_FR1]|uniref:methyl-accepting chemotaxis protein n=1 Tax=Massilia sp. S19_KUP03_FR1 TaxID=3025503 RepID=UPI002FCD99A3